MASSLLEKTRKITKLLETNVPQSIAFSDVCAVLGGLLNSNVYIASKKGKILGVYVKDAVKAIKKLEVGEYLDENQNDEILTIKETLANVKVVELRNFENTLNPEDSITIIPINIVGDRMGTLILDNGKMHFSDDDLVLAEYGSTVVGMEILRAESEENEEEVRKTTVVQLSLGTLSYSEMEAITNILSELEGNEGLLVASKIADKAGITRSVIVNALRKLESAGVIESRSLGMKGTYIRITNNKLLEEVQKIIKK